MAVACSGHHRHVSRPSKSFKSVRGCACAPPGRHDQSGWGSISRAAVNHGALGTRQHAANTSSRGGTAAAGRRPARPATPAALPRGSAAANMQHHCLRVLCQSVDLLTHSLHSVRGTQHAAVGGRCGRLQPTAPASAVLTCSGFGGQGVAPGRAAPENADGMELKACTLVGGVDGPCAAWGVRRGEEIPPGVICWGSPCCSATTLARRSSRRAAGSSRCVIDASR